MKTKGDGAESGREGESDEDEDGDEAGGEE